MAPRNFATVCFRAHPPGLDGPELNGFNQALMDTVNRSGEFFISHTVVRGDFIIRASIGNIWVTWEHIVKLQDCLTDAQHAVGRKYQAASN
jgi:aromatic-L-amino-acid decarboxylase